MCETSLRRWLASFLPRPCRDYTYSLSKPIMKQTLYQAVAPKPDDDSFLLQIKERDKEFVVTQIRNHYDSKSGIQESTVRTITSQHPFVKRSEAMQVYESHRRTLAAKGYKHAFSPDAFSIGYTYEEIKAG
jgi:hypothetical protein